MSPLTDRELSNVALGIMACRARRRRDRFQLATLIVMALATGANILAETVTHHRLYLFSVAMFAFLTGQDLRRWRDGAEDRRRNRDVEAALRRMGP